MAETSEWAKREAVDLRKRLLTDLAHQSFRDHYDHQLALALDAARRKGIEACVNRTTEEIAILGSVLVGKPHRDAICRTLIDLNKQLRALIDKEPT